MPYTSIVRNAEYIDRLKEFIQESYALDIASIAPAKRGFYGETWRRILRAEAPIPAMGTQFAVCLRGER